MRYLFFSATLSILIGISPAASPAAADLGLRCGPRLITAGDSIERVLNECGEPATVDRWEEERIHSYRHHFHDDSDEFDIYGPVGRVIVRVTVEVWTYNHGPHRFIDRVRFENGRVRKITSGRYGY